MKKLKTFLLFLIGLVLFSAFNVAKAENFTIDNYTINIFVMPDGTMNVEEKLDVNFTNPSHGIIREIPIINNVKRADKTGYTNKAEIRSLEVSENFSKSYENDNLKIKIGDADKLINGHKFYKIKYKYILEEKAKKQNEFYFNIVGDKWNTSIKNVDFTVNMPKSFDKNKVGLSIGKYGDVGFNNKTENKIENGIGNEVGQSAFNPNKFEISNKTVFGKASLNNNEAITLRIELPENYYIKRFDFIKIGCVFLIIILTFISLITWSYFGKDDIIIPVVNFKSPYDLPASKVQVIYKEEADFDTIITLILELANEKYLTIEETNIDGFK